MYIFAEPMTDEEINKIQTRNRDKIEEFERDILGLGSVGANNEQDSEDASFEDGSSQDEWKRIQAKVEEEIAQDELSVEDPRNLHTEKPEQEFLQSDEVDSDTTTGNSQDVKGDDHKNAVETGHLDQQSNSDKESLESKANHSIHEVNEKEEIAQNEGSAESPHTLEVEKLEQGILQSHEVDHDTSEVNIPDVNENVHKDAVGTGHLDQQSSSDQEPLKSNANSLIQEDGEKEEIAQGEVSFENPHALGAEELEQGLLRSDEVDHNTSVTNPEDVNGNGHKDAVEVGHLDQQEKYDEELLESQAIGSMHESNEREVQILAKEGESNIHLANSEAAGRKGLSNGEMKEHTETVGGAKGLTGSENQEDQSPPNEDKKKKKGKKKAKAEAEAEAEEPADDILAMTLTIRNVVNGVYVKRPRELEKQDDWLVEYCLAQIPLKTRAWSLYRACQARRQKGLEKEDEQESGNAYIRRLRKLSASGRAWRKKEDDLNAAKGEMVFDRSSPRGS